MADICSPTAPPKWKIFSIVATGVFMSTMDSSMVNIALPTIMVEFQSPLKTTQWVVLVYLLTITSSLLLWGHLSDRFGQKKIYSAGLLFFAAGSLACSCAMSLTWLIISRFCQAIGASMMMSTGPAIIKENFPANQLGQSLGMIGVSVSLGLMIGPALGGFLLDFFSWRALFLVTVPIGLFFSTFAWKVIPDTKQAGKAQSFNWPNALCWISLITTVSFAITYASSPAWSGRILAGLLLSVVLILLLFIYLEQRSKTAFLPTRLIQQRFFYAAMISAVLSFMVLFSTLILMPFYLDRILGLEKSTIGLVMMSLPAAVLIVAPAAGWLSDYVASRKLSTLGLFISTVSLCWLATITESSTIKEVVYRLVLLGCGQAMFLSPNSASVLHQIDGKDGGKSAALLATARNMGMLLGIGQSSLVFSFYFSQLTGGLDMLDFTPENIPAFIVALQKAFQAAVFTGIVGMLVSWFRGDNQSRKTFLNR